MYLNMNKLKLNTEKTKVLILPSNSEINYIEEFECVKEIKYLGILIDSNFNFKRHFESMYKKISKKIGLFQRIRMKLSTSMAIKIYNTIINPHFEYCPTILLLGTNGMIQNLQILQNKAMRSILKCNRYTPISNILSILNWLSIKQRIIFCTLLFIYKIKNNLTPNYLQRKLTRRADVQPYNLRNNNNLNVQFFTNNRTQNMLFYKGLQMFNSLPNDVQIENNMLRFKNKISQFVKHNY